MLAGLHGLKISSDPELPQSGGKGTKVLKTFHSQ